ncbi:unnamed protein product, partial [Meganyctiphanes norvegica]
MDSDTTHDGEIKVEEEIEIHEEPISYSSGNSSVKHKVTHTEKIPYEFSHCGKTFSNKYDPTLHSRKHAGENSYKCIHHDKESFKDTTPRSLMMIQTEVKLDKCSYCFRVFSNKSNFIRHMRTHSGEKPYKCSQCDKYFSKKGNLESH